MKSTIRKRMHFIPTGFYSDTLNIPGVRTVKFKEMIDALLVAAKNGIEKDSEMFNRIIDEIRNFALHLLCKQNAVVNDYNYGDDLYRFYGLALEIIKKHLNEVYSECENQFDYVQCIGGYIVQIANSNYVPVKIQMVDADSLPAYAMSTFGDIEDAIRRGSRSDICKLAIGLSLDSFIYNNLDVEKELPNLLECIHSKIKFEALQKAYRFTFENGTKIDIAK